MAEITFTGNKTVKGLCADFKKAFNVDIRIYSTPKSTREADPSATLSSLRAEGKKGGDLKVGGNKLVGNFEKDVMEMFGIKVNVLNKDGKPISNDVTLASAGK